MRLAAFLCLALACAPPPPRVAPRELPEPTATWVELGPGGAAIARAIVERLPCPTIALEGSVVPMDVRAAPEGRFHEHVCEALLPPGTPRALIQGRPLPVPRPARRVVVIGDTGCRLKKQDIQACNDLERWPFAHLAHTVAEERPDLVIHVGDYVYRERACPEGRPECAQSPYGDQTDTWMADFFAPARPLLRAAPFVFVRGNHEGCARSGNGWFRYLDPHPRPRACEDFTPPYAVPLERAALLVLDSVKAADQDGVQADAQRYRDQLAMLARVPAEASWLVAHHPFYALEPDQKRPGELREINATLQAAASDGLPRSVQLLLAGHLHLFQAVSFPGRSGEPRRPPQITVGTGGTTLDEPPAQALGGRLLAGLKVLSPKVIDRFGYLLVEPAGRSAWIATLKTEHGDHITTCRIRELLVTCDP